MLPMLPRCCRKTDSRQHSKMPIYLRFVADVADVAVFSQESLNRKEE
jgi:hypothetical protein